MAGPPMSMFSTQSSNVPPFATVERVEVGDEQVDGRDVVPRHVVGVQVAPGQQPAVDARVQRLHPPVHHLGKAGVVGDLLHRHARGPQRRGRPARRQDLDAPRHERGREIDEARLVGDGQKRAGDLDGGHRRNLGASGSAASL
jgi:hypothetical protein